MPSTRNARAIVALVAATVFASQASAQSVAFATIDPKFRADATALFTLVRSIGSSIGISIVSVLLARNIQINHAELGTSISPFNSNLTQAVPTVTPGNFEVLSQLDGLVNIQALMVSYLDDFKLMMIVALCVIPLVFFLSKGDEKPSGGTPVAHAD